MKIIRFRSGKLNPTYYFFILLGFLTASCKTEEPQNPPTVVTKIAFDVSLNKATLNGEVTNEGYSAASERGFVYSDKNNNPSVSDSKINSGYGKGVFSILLDGLSVNTKYHFKAFATNTKGTSYGEALSFTTADYNLASLSTEIPKNITFNSAEMSGVVSNQGGGNVIERGFCFGFNPNPTTADNKLAVSSKGQGAFTLVIINLKGNTKYYIRSYAINEKGTAYGNEQNFTTLNFNLPTLTTGNIDNISYQSANVVITITNDGGTPLLSKGVVWGTSPNPSVNLNTKTTESPNSVGYSSISNLSGNTTYYVRGYASNVVGTAYGNEVIFKTPNIKVVAGGNGRGSAQNQFNSPELGLFLDGAGNLYVADRGNHRVQKWAPGASSGTTVAGGNGQGGAANQLDYPSGIFLDKNGDLYISDYGNHRIQRWKPGATSGVTVAGGNGSGPNANQITSPTGVFVDPNGNIYISDLGGGVGARVQKWAPGASSGTTVAGGNGRGDGANQLRVPYGLWVDESNNVYVAETFNHRVQKWAPGATSGVTVAGGNGRGASDNQLSAPSGLFLDRIGNVFVADWGNQRIQKWAPGASKGITVVEGNGLESIRGIISDANGDIYLIDENKNHVLKWGQ